MNPKFYVILLFFAASLFSACPIRVSAQAESHNFITYDTLIVVRPDPTNAYYYGNMMCRITRPAGMFTDDTASRPAIITMEGQGEQGSTDTSKLSVYGPHYFLKQGSWDGGVTLGNGTHYPILITVQSQSTKYPTPDLAAALLQTLLNTYHIKRNSVHLGGLSQGSFMWTSMIAYEATAGAETGMKLVTSLTALEGFSICCITGGQSSWDAWSRRDTAWGVWAKKYNGHFFGLEGTNDYRNVAEAEKAMNDSVKGSAHFTYENLGSGAHCCWNSMYDPTQHNWQSFAPYGTYVALGTDTNSRGNYITGSSIFQWMLRQGDTSLVLSGAASPQAPVVSAGSAQTITLPTSQVTLSGTASDPSGGTVSYTWTKSSGGEASITSPSSATTTVTGLAAGTYVFQLTALTSEGMSSTSTVQVTVEAAAAAPPSAVSSGSLYVKKVIVAEYKTWYVGTDGLIYSYNSGSPFPVNWPIGGRTTVAGAGGFNFFQVIDDQGYVWKSRLGNVTISDRVETDTTGAAFDGNVFIDAYAKTAVTIRTDGSIWYWGNDSYNLFYTGGVLASAGTGVAMLPTQLSPSGLQFKKVLLGGNRIIALTTAGQVYVWNPGNRTPVLKTLPRAATDIFVSHLDIAGCIVPDAGESSGLGYPYVLGTTTSMYGGGTAYSEFTSLKALWKMTVPVKEICASWNTIHYIDSLGRMFGCGFNSMGEVGNGVEFVNKYTYPGFPGYGWSFTDYENPSGIPVEIGAGTKWSHLYSNNWFSFYKYAQDANDSIYSWGRNKALVLGNGFYNIQESTSYDAMDVLTPTMVHPLTTRYQQYNFTKPSISATATVSGTTATLTGTATAVAVTSNGTNVNGIPKVGYTIASYAWTKVSGNGGTITSPGSATTTVTGLTTGESYVFQLVTTDNNTGTQMVQVSATASSPAAGTPVASAGSDQTITLPTNSVTLTGSGSETNGTISSYAWTQVSGPSVAVFGTAGSAVTTAGELVQGVYVLQLTITDATGVKATSTVQVTVNAAPVVAGPPVASAGSDQTITLPTNSVTLTGSGSETNGTISSYAWTQVSGPSTAVFGTAGSAVTTAGGLVQGQYIFQLKVTDNSGSSATDVVTVTVDPAVPVPGTPVANAGTNQTITLPVNSVVLSGSGSEVNGSITGYSWTQVSGPSTATIATAGQASTTAGGLTAGVYRFQLKVTDASGLTATSTVQITVNTAPVVPGTPVANAGSDQTITLPTNSVTLTGSGSETNGTIVSYEWVQVSGPSASSIAAIDQAITTASGLTEGIYEFRLTVTDALGITSSALVKVTVNPAIVVPVNQAPIANAGPDQTVDSATVVQLDATASYDPDGTISKYEWIQLSGKGGVTISNANSATPMLYGLTPAEYTFRLTVTDNEGATAMDDVKITVVSAAAVPPAVLTLVANAGTDTTLIYPAQSSTILTGSGSAEQGGTISDYTWRQVSGPSMAVLGNATTDVSVSNLIPGDYVFELTVTDAAGSSAKDSVTVHVKSNLRSGGIKVGLYPNPVPVGQQLTVGISSDKTLGKVKLTVYSFNGMVVKEITFSSQFNSVQQALPVSGLSRGVYVLEIRFDGTQKPYIQSFVVD